MLINKTTLYTEGNRRLTELENFIDEKKKKLKNAPQGSIRFIKRKNTVQYYLRKSPKEIGGKYLRKNQIGTIKKYLQKSYDVKVLKMLEQEDVLLRKFLEKAGNFEKIYETVYSDLPEEVKNMVEPIDMSDEEYSRGWENAAYVPKPISDDVKTRKTNKGEYVRSKSELTIANALFLKKIPYKYECPLKLKNGLIIYPDFTVLNVRQRKVYYWEHRGMMDDRDYAKNAVDRQKEYIKSGIMLGDSLVITEETLNSTLSTGEIDAIINTYFL